MSKMLYSRLQRLAWRPQSAHRASASNAVDKCDLDTGVCSTRSRQRQNPVWMKYLYAMWCPSAMRINTAQRATRHDIQFCSINCFVVMCQRTWYIIHSLHSADQMQSCEAFYFFYWLYLCRLRCLFYLVFAHFTFYLIFVRAAATQPHTL